ncbi:MULTISPECIES: acyltransferase [unclassified Fibrobacter]|uniref:acyltransferase family protein n=1 Tax=unclassified Fibrobacter TaxID=2634177 RepID=UPI000D6CCD08|nr:acyltransferase-like protein [Fibrobacter sp. UWR4]PZW61971.1 acyltransferase-like protein [Fibrobacter sp. UWR1]
MTKNFDLFLYTCDYEYIVIFLVILILFIIGLKKKDLKSENRFTFSLDKNISSALKGISCLMILLGHFAQMQLDYTIGDPKSLNSIVSWTLPNIALAWFMFISGYGLTKKNQDPNSLKKECLSRNLKVFLPMIATFCISLILYVILPIKFNNQEISFYHIPDEAVLIKRFCITDIPYILLGSIRWYWYVWCIIIFYTIYYTSIYISTHIFSGKKASWTLLFLLVLYYIAAFNILGQSLAHYYRLTWAFFLGHIFAQWRNLPICPKWAMILISLSSFIFENSHMIISFVLAVASLALCSAINKHFDFKGKHLLFLGSISYFYYLCHRRISWIILCYLGIHDVLCWTVFSIVTAWLIYIVYNKTVKKFL